MKKILVGLVSIVGIYYIGKITKEIIEEIQDENTIGRGIRGAGESMGYEIEEIEDDE